MTTTKKFRPTDGRPLTPHEREILTVLQEECAEVAKECNAVIVKASKLLRFGANNTNPDTRLVNTDELCLELGDLDVMLGRFAKLKGLFNRDKFEEGRGRKIVRLATYLQTAP